MKRWRRICMCLFRLLVAGEMGWVDQKRGLILSSLPCSTSLTTSLNVLRQSLIGWVQRLKSRGGFASFSFNEDRHLDIPQPTSSDGYPRCHYFDSGDRAASVRPPL